MAKVKEPLARAAALFIDIAGSTKLRSTLGDEEAGRRLAALLEEMTTLVRMAGGEVLKSEGDDIFAVFLKQAGGAQAAVQAAADSQLLARSWGLAVYAGIGAGTLRPVRALGKTNYDGLCINVAARLHKLIANQPGFVFLDEHALAELTPETSALCRPFGDRDLKGVGVVPVFTMDWDSERSAALTDVARHLLEGVVSVLTISLNNISRRFHPEQRMVMIGRSSSCHLLVDGPLISARHLEFVWESGAWSARDLSRNGTWALLAGMTSEMPLNGRSIVLTKSGRFTLGQPFTTDTGGRATLAFEQVAS